MSLSLLCSLHFLLKGWANWPYSKPSSPSFDFDFILNMVCTFTDNFSPLLQLKDKFLVLVKKATKPAFDGAANDIGVSHIEYHILHPVQILCYRFATRVKKRAPSNKIMILNTVVQLQYWFLFSWPNKYSKWELKICVFGQICSQHFFNSI